MKICYVFLFTFFLGSLLQAQNVTTLVSHPELRDGLHVDPAGNIYTTSGGLAGFEIGKYDIQTGNFDPLFAQGFLGPVDVDVYQDSLLIVSNYDNNTLVSYHLETGVIKTIASGLDGPSGIATDANDNIYVASWGNAPNYAGHQIHRIDPSGAVSNYIDSPLLYRPQAMTVNHDNQLIVHNQEMLYKVVPQDSSLQLFANMGTVIGHLVFRQRDSCLYGTALGEHKILKVDANGFLSEFAGSVQGYQDGPLESALFNGPLGIEISPDENQLYVCETAYSEPIGRIRSIDLEQAVWVAEVISKDLEVYPNPVSDVLQIEQGDAVGVAIGIFDVVGKRVLSTWEHSSLINLDVSHLDKGVYVLRLTYPDGIISHKFVRK